MTISIDRPLESLKNGLSEVLRSAHGNNCGPLKDEVLDCVAKFANVAQFVSFDPNLEQRFSRVLNYDANYRFPNIDAAIGELLDSSPEHRVNIRTFKPGKLTDNPFRRLLETKSEILSSLHELGQSGFFTIVNENIDINDGGVSGVLLNGVAEFAPGDTPRCVERAEVAVLPLDEAKRLIKQVYGFTPELDHVPNLRIEFSIHPNSAGFRRTKTIIWEVQENHGVIQADVSWPNAFSRWVGDKVFGLLMADLRGFRVPFSVVLARRLPPFSFGTPTNTGMKWVRPAPAVKLPGKFDSERNLDRSMDRGKWKDPFQVLAEQDPNPEAPLISSLIIQDGVTPEWSGAIVTQADGTPKIEGRRGFGDVLMVGKAGPTQLRSSVTEAVEKLHSELTAQFGSVRVEWVYDGNDVWIVQLQQEPSLTKGDTIVPGEANVWYPFHVGDGLLERLREFIPSAKYQGAGVILVGNIGLTSHLADVLREAHIPSKRERNRNRQILLFGDPKENMKEA